MKYFIYLFCLFPFLLFAQVSSKPFKKGEFLKFKISYGVLNAGMATLEMDEMYKNSDTLIHINGNGWSTGMVDLFFPVKDNYQTYFYKNSFKPYHFIRNISEGSYTKNTEIFFDFEKLQAKVINHKKNRERLYPIHENVQDMLSSLYYLRNIDFSDKDPGDAISFDMFLDNEIFTIKLYFKARETLSFNKKKVKTIVLQPMVQEGRIFSSKESVTFWVSDDLNKIPIKIKASVLVGSLKAELIEYKGLTNPLKLIFN